jgi:hypothetical protein
VQYRIKESALPVVEEAIESFMKAKSDHEPDTVYNVYRELDGVSFIHFMIFPDHDTDQRNRTSLYTHRFVEIR